MADQNENIKNRNRSDFEVNEKIGDKHPILYRRDFIRKSRTRRAAKNLKRRLRRKRSITRYYTNLKYLRHKRRASESFGAEDFGFSDLDMECVPSKYFKFDNPLAAVAEWHTQEQIAYWKSRAISLEYENRMLYTHLKCVYEHDIKEISNNYGEDKNISKDHKDPKLTKRESSCKRYETETENAIENVDDGSSGIVNRKHEALERKEQMIRLYGKAASKITGMETAIQLNYDHNTSNSKIPFWPNIPLKL